MFMLRTSYSKIPNLYQIWYGDDYLAQHSKNIFAINTNKIKGKISETLTKFNDPNCDVSKRIELDSKNLLRFNHFKNSNNWDIPSNMIKMYESQRKTLALSKNIFETEYERAKKTPSDINQNVHILYELAKECKTVVELGVRTGVSTRAFLNSDVDLLSIDIVKNDQVQQLFDKAKSHNKNVRYIIDNVLNIEINEVDMIFIDTLHTYNQLKQELKLHGNKSKKYLVFHDTYTFGLIGEDGIDKKGLLTAIIEFMIDNPHWKFKTFKTINNGMTVLERM
jgi:predicted O-methyltransferase YrrM